MTSAHRLLYVLTAQQKPLKSRAKTTNSPKNIAFDIKNIAFGILFNSKSKIALPKSLIFKTLYS